MMKWSILVAFPIYVLLTILFHIPEGYSYSTDPVQVNALVDFYYATEEGLKNYRGWDTIASNGSISDPCVDNWYGITCSSNIINNNYEGVQTMSLANLTLKGTIPASIGNLTTLINLDFSENQLEGSIPDSIGNLSQLQNLDFDNNNLNGSIPDFIGNLGQLHYLYLFDNNLNGSIPDSIGNLGQLRDLYLAYNNLNGSLPDSIGSIRRLQYLLLNNNRLTGSIPDSIGNLGQLIELSLTYNNLTGSIPDSIGSIRRLQYLLLNNNRLTGSLPDSIGNLGQLQKLFIDFNNLTGSLPDSIGNLGQLQKLFIDYNNLTGSIPDSIGNLGQLKQLHLFYNNLTGSIPSSIGMLDQLHGMYLMHNMLTGTIPDSIGNMTQLKLLELSNNLLRGTIPASIGNLVLLENMYLQANSLTGTLPDSLKCLSNLTAIFLENNQLSGSIPDIFQSLMIEQLSLYNNQLIGSLPPSLLQSKYLYMLLLYSNQLTGSVGDFPNTQLGAVYLCYNLFTGPISPVFAGQRELKQVQLQGNLFTGSLQSILDANQLTPLGQTIYEYLESLELSSNLLSGSIPSGFFSQVPSLQNISLGENCLTGSLPSAICSVTNLSVLSLGGLNSAQSCSSRSSRYQLFSLIKGYVLQSSVGSIPDCLWKLPHLLSVDMSGNGMTGNLEVLDENSLGGLTNLTLSYNRLTGSIPMVLQQSSTLMILDLSYNKFNGHIDSLGNASPKTENNDKPSSFQVYLQVNRLSGKLPPGIRDMKGLNILQGNVFSCVDYASRAPVNDPNYDKYSCGSSQLDNPMILFALCLGSLLLATGLLYKLINARFPALEDKNVNAPAVIWLTKLRSFWLEMKTLILRRAPAWGIWVRYPDAGLEKFMGTNYLYFQRSINLIRHVSLLVSLFALCICMPVYMILYRTSNDAGNPKDGNYSLFNDQYGWFTTSLFLTGDVPAAVLLSLWSLGLLGSVVFVLEHLRGASKVDSNDTIATSAMNSSSMPTRYPSLSNNKDIVVAISFFLVNLVLTLTLNILYVNYVDKSGSSTVVSLLLQIAFSLYKLLWNILFVKRTIRYLPFTTATVNMVYAMLVFNLTIAPMLASSIYSSQCFYNYFFGTQSIQSYYTYYFCIIRYTGFCISEVSINAASSYNPGFIYLFSCSSALLTYYIPVYTIASIIMLVISLLVTLCLAFLGEKYLPFWLLQLSPELLQSSRHSKMVNEYSKTGLYNIHFLLFTNYMLLFTFGFVSPILCVFLALGIAANSYIWQYMLERSLVSSKVETSLSQEIGNGSTNQVLNPLNPSDVKPSSETRSRLDIENQIELAEIRSFQSTAPAQDASSEKAEIESKDAIARPLDSHDKPSDGDVNVGITSVATKLDVVDMENCPHSNSNQEDSVVESGPNEKELSVDKQASVDRLCPNKQLDEACEGLWKILRKSMYMVIFSSFLFYSLIMLDMSGNQGGVSHTLWVAVVIPVLFSLSLTLTRFYIHRF